MIDTLTHEFDTTFNNIPMMIYVEYERNGQYDIEVLECRVEQIRDVELSTKEQHSALAILMGPDFEDMLLEMAIEEIKEL